MLMMIGSQVETIDL
jgi:hypothetical protein